jgi:TorA maturation chaperone TorD
MNAIETDRISLKKEEELCLRLLAACFYEPDKEVLLENELFENLGKHMKTVCPDAASFAESMKKTIEEYSSEDLKIAYAKLFVGPFGLLAAPYGSVYLDEGGRVMGDSTMEVIKCFEEEKLTRSDDCKDLPDHIAIELEFVSFLAFKELNALEKSDTDAADKYAAKQQSFTNDFIKPWVPEFCEKIKNGTDNKFYQDLADCASMFISREPRLSI